MSKLLTTREAAALLGVGTSSVKRWADEGLLQCVKTPGGHRRFPRANVEAMIRAEGQEPTDSGDWIELLTQGTSPHEVYRRLCDERDRANSWWQVAQAATSVLIEVGERWSRGELTVLQEHLASERLQRALARCVEDVSPPVDSPSALLLAAEGDDHTLGLGLAELVLREAGWITRWSGRRTPRPAIEGFVASGEVELIVVSAAASVTDRPALADLARWLGDLCQRHGLALIMGGAGAWPEPPPYGARLASFEELARHAGMLRG